MLYIPRHTVRRATACNSNKVRPGSSLPAASVLSRGQPISKNSRTTDLRHLWNPRFPQVVGVPRSMWRVLRGPREPMEHDDHHHSQLDEGGSQESLQGASQQSFCEKSLTST